MAKDDRREILWVSFSPGVRIHGGSSESPAAAKSESCRIFKGIVEGELSVIVEDTSIATPVTVPWHAVGSIVYMPVVVDESVKAKAAAKPVEHHQ
jgi:hypothetical protein